MPRKPLDHQHNGRYVRRHLSGVNNFRKYEVSTVLGTRERYCLPMEPGEDRAVLRNLRMKPLLNNGRKHRG